MPDKDDEFIYDTNLLPPAPLDAELEMVVEGKTFQCKDGTILGKEGKVGYPLLSRYEQLEPRHLLFGKEGHRWFVLTPTPVKHPFWMDNHRLIPGERTLLIKVRHHLALDDLRIGLRLKPHEKKSFFSWLKG